MRHNKSSRRKRNPVPTGIILGTVVTVLGITAYALSSSEPAKKKASPCAPYKYNEATVRASIESMLDRGDTDAGKIAVTVATTLFGQHPSGVTVTFPPPQASQPGVQCVWERVIGMVNVIYDERDIVPDDDGPIDVIDIDPINDLSGYPWETPGVDPDNYPTPGLFVDLNRQSQGWNVSSGLSSLAESALHSAFAMAASLGHDVSAGQAIMQANANTSSSKRQLLEDMRELMIQCSSYNDAMFGTTAVPASGNYALGPNGRTLSYMPRHNDNLARMRQGKSPKRAIRLNGSHISGQGNKQAQYWVPAINLELLAGNSPVVSVSGMTWSDGVSTIEPPPAVRRLGVDMSGVSLPGGAGC